MNLFWETIFMTVATVAFLLSLIMVLSYLNIIPTRLKSIGMLREGKVSSYLRIFKLLKFELFVIILGLGLVTMFIFLGWERPFFFNLVRSFDFLEFLVYFGRPRVFIPLFCLIVLLAVFLFFSGSNIAEVLEDGDDVYYEIVKGSSEGAQIYSSTYSETGELILFCDDLAWVNSNRYRVVKRALHHKAREKKLKLVLKYTADNVVSDLVESGAKVFRVGENTNSIYKFSILIKGDGSSIMLFREKQQSQAIVSNQHKIFKYVNNGEMVRNMHAVILNSLENDKEEVEKLLSVLSKAR